MGAVAKLSGVGLAIALGLAGCGGDGKGAISTGGVNREDAGRNPDRDWDDRDAAPRGGTGGQPVDREPDAGTDSGTTSQPTCGNVNCGPNGDCVEDMVGVAGCVCDRGYVVNALSSAALCVEDRNCVEVRLVECRIEFGSSGSAVGMHVSMQYCSGNPYTALQVDDLVLEERGNEDWEALRASESALTIVDRESVSHIYLIVDVSQSIRDSDVLDDVADGIDMLLTQLDGLSGEFRVAVFLFDGASRLYEFVPETANFAAVRAMLPSLPVADADDPGSSNVYGALELGIREVQRARALKDLNSLGGILSTGTVIMVSDGDDEAGLRTFDQVKALVDPSVENVITVGLGDEANYPKLTQLGRDGSFSAPTPALVSQAFSQIGERFEKYAESLYFLGYCSPKRGGQASARVSIRDHEGNQPSCTISAENFGPGCTAALFSPATSCAGRSCDGILGCGECPAGQCCHNSECVGPSKAPLDAICGTELQCNVGLTCSAGTCKAPVATLATCGTDLLCDAGTTYCFDPDPMSEQPPTHCAATKAPFTSCMAAGECESLNCAEDPNDVQATTKRCLTTPRMFESCEGASLCEAGTFCNDAKTCERQRMPGNQCTGHDECLSGNCVELVSGTKSCSQQASCYFPLDL